MANELVKHFPPKEGQTLYLPDSPNDITAIDAYDKALGEANAKLFTYPPELVRSYDDGPCDKGCVETITKTPSVDPTAVAGPLADFAEHLAAITAALDAEAGEQQVDRLRESVYGPGGRADLAKLADATDTVVKALENAVAVTNAAAERSYAAFRGNIKRLRENIAAAAPEDLTDGGGIGGLVRQMLGAGTGSALGGFIPGGQIPGALIGFWTSGGGERPADWSDPTAVDIDTADAMHRAAAAEIEKALATLEDAVDEWVRVIPASGGGGELYPGNEQVPSPIDAEEPTPDTPLPAAASGGVGDGAVTPAPVPAEDDEPKSFMDELGDKLGTDPLGGGLGESPFGGGGIPGLGGSPFGSGGSPLPSGGENPFDSAANPLENLSDSESPFDKEEDDEILDEGEGGIEDEADDAVLDEGEGGFNEDDGAPVIEETGGGDADGDTDEGEEAPVTVEAAAAPPAPAAVDPNSEAARTVALPDGRQVVFPDARTAEMVRALVAAVESGAPTSITAAAGEAGFEIQPLGSDMGTPVTPLELTPGDVIATSAGNGVFIGNGEVLMETGEVKPLDEVTANIGDGSQGLWRMIQPGEDTSTVATAGESGAASGSGSTTGGESPAAGGAVEDTVTPVGAPEAGGEGAPTDPAGSVPPVQGFGDVTHEESIDPDTAAF